MDINELVYNYFRPTDCDLMASVLAVVIKNLEDFQRFILTSFEDEDNMEEVIAYLNSLLVLLDKSKNSMDGTGLVIINENALIECLNSATK